VIRQALITRSLHTVCS